MQDSCQARTDWWRCFAKFRDFVLLFIAPESKPQWQVMGPTDKVLWGESDCRESIAGLDLSMSFGSFLHVNTS